MKSIYAILIIKLKHAPQKTRKKKNNKKTKKQNKVHTFYIAEINNKGVFVDNKQNIGMNVVYHNTFFKEWVWESWHLHWILNYNIYV